MALKTNFLTINSWTIQFVHKTWGGVWVVIAISSLFYFVVSISVTTYFIVMNVALIIEATERYFVYFVTSK